MPRLKANAKDIVARAVDMAPMLLLLQKFLSKQHTAAQRKTPRDRADFTDEAAEPCIDDAQAKVTCRLDQLQT